jgi:hypothetical protein
VLRISRVAYAQLLLIDNFELDGAGAIDADAAAGDSVDSVGDLRAHAYHEHATNYFRASSIAGTPQQLSQARQAVKSASAAGGGADAAGATVVAAAVKKTVGGGGGNAGGGGGGGGGNADANAKTNSGSDKGGAGSDVVIDVDDGMDTGAKKANGPSGKKAKGKKGKKK